MKPGELSRPRACSSKDDVVDEGDEVDGVDEGIGLNPTVRIGFAPTHVLDCAGRR